MKVPFKMYDMYTRGLYVWLYGNKYGDTYGSHIVWLFNLEFKYTMIGAKNAQNT